MKNVAAESSMVSRIAAEAVAPMKIPSRINATQLSNGTISNHGKKA